MEGAEATKVAAEAPVEAAPSASQEPVAQPAAAQSAAQSAAQPAPAPAQPQEASIKPQVPQQQPSAVLAQRSNPNANSKPQENVQAPAQQRPTLKMRDRYNYQCLGASLNTSLKQARVLMVGAGGIGCELLKNLVLSGFGEIHIVDLDTIDLSNLNRQFLFRHEHIKKSKALVAKEVAQRFNPNAQIVAHHANIKDPQFNISWFRGFTLVFNALDNLEARRHVNRMCLAADVPLVESGTTGFNGQVQVIKKGVTACYDCTPKETPKTFPVCTIRSTPSQPIHCIVWGKSYLLNEIFGVSEDQTAFDHSEDSDNAKEIEELKKESEALKKIRDAIGTPEFAKELFDKAFKKDIERLRSVEDMWKTRRAPEPLNYDETLEKAASAIATIQDILSDDQRVWSLEENFAVFLDSLDRLGKRSQALKSAAKDAESSDSAITFDKDDQDTLDFVAASANMRSTIFGIESKSRFDIKQMAGNIIPAIATTNAIVAGLCVLEAYKILKGDYKQAKEVFLTPFASARLLAPDRSRLPNADCPVCGVFYTTLKADCSRATLKDIVDGFVKENLGFKDKEFALSNDVGVLYDPDETENLTKSLKELGVKDDTFLTVTDEDDEKPFVNVVISIENTSMEESEKPFKADFTEVPEIPVKPKTAEATQDANGNGHQNGNGSSTNDDSTSTVNNLKRSNDDEGDQPSKKTKLSDKAPDLAILVEDAGGAIVID